MTSQRHRLRVVLETDIVRAVAIGEPRRSAHYWRGPLPPVREQNQATPSDPALWTDGPWSVRATDRAGSPSAGRRQVPGLRQ